MRTLTGIAVMALGMTLAGSASAHGWRFLFGYGPAYGQQVQSDWQDSPDWQAQRLADAVCSGQRAAALEQRVRHEADEGDIDPGMAERLHEEIDHAEDNQRHECEERDWRGITRVAERYNRIEGWINAQAGRNRWRAGW